MTLRTRFAPSPTGDLHLGGAFCALASLFLAKKNGGTFVVRMEDLDPPRVVAGSAQRILEDLRWLDLEGEEGPLANGTEIGGHGPYAQSRRGEIYRDAVRHLEARGLIYPCDCSRSEIARIASAPHAGEEVIYPGTCRDADPQREFKRAPALRVRVPDDVTFAIEDRFAGRVEQKLRTDVGDFVLVRGDGVFAYQLAVVVDDLAMHITDVIRGDDLVSSTPRQVWLAKELVACGAAFGIGDMSIPRYAHLPLVVDENGERIAKRTPGAHVRALRESGVAAEAIVGVLAHALGLVDHAAPVDTKTLCREARDRELAPTQLRIPHAWRELQRVTSDR